MTREPRKVRPGQVIKDVLSREMACCTDICNQYQKLTNLENEARKLAGKPPLRSMTVNSFVKLMAFARLLGFITFDHEQPYRYKGGPLYRVDKSNTVLTAPVSNRRYYRLTDKGREETTAWDDLTRYYKESIGYTKRS